MTGESLPTTAPSAPDGAVAVFGDRLDLAVRFVGHLATSAVERGLLGPREVPRLWERHVLNCAVVGELLEPGERCVDVGSGAGLPGIALAIARPDVRVTLVEPLQRRVTWLREVVADLGLDGVEVVRGRAEEVRGSAPGFDVATARAVAPLDRLASWCLPLLRPAGRLLALKGRTAAEELRDAGPALDRWGVVSRGIVVCGEGVVDEPTTVVVVEAGEVPAAGRPPGRSRAAGSRSAKGQGGRRSSASRSGRQDRGGRRGRRGPAGDAGRGGAGG